MARTPWFGPKRLGVGIRPIAWQGWAVTFGLPVMILAAATWLTSRG